MANRPNTRIEPINSKATELIRQKVASMYNEEPNAKAEISEVQNTKVPSRHQKFMQQLVNSGEDIATIQTKWHSYYQSLPENEKLEVWDEFYASNKNAPQAAVIEPDQPRKISQVKNEVIHQTKYRPKRTAAKAHRPVISDSEQTAKSQPKVRLQAKHHIQSLVFGLCLGFLAIVIFLFGFFNEIVITPFIEPSRNVSVPVIVGNNSVAPTNATDVIIPKINVDIPVDYNINTTNENVIENDLEQGVIHFPTTVLPGQLGNAAFFGHSSNNIFNPGRYKFAFVLLHTLVNGDTFYLTYNHTVYVYKVISHFIVNPSDTAVLGPVKGQTATATLITCDPPGTSINRLVVIGQQISPSISVDSQPTTTTNPVTTTTSLPGNGPTLWSRFIDSSKTKVALVIAAAVIIVIIFRRTSKREPF